MRTFDGHLQYAEVGTAVYKCARDLKDGEMFPYSTRRTYDKTVRHHYMPHSIICAIHLNVRSTIRPLLNTFEIFTLSNLARICIRRHQLQHTVGAHKMCARMR